MIEYQLTLFIGNDNCFVSYADEESNIKFVGETDTEGYPTSLWFNGQSRFFGKDAIKKARTNPVKYYRNLILELDKKKENRKKFEFNGREFGTKGLLALILINIKKNVCGKLKLNQQEPLKVLLVVPQYVIKNIDEIKTACHYANIKIVSVLPESMAVCCAYRVFPEDQKRAVVVDLSSEFKMDLVEGTGNEYRIIKNVVNTQFGYPNLVKKLKDHVLMKIKNETGNDFEECATDEDKIDLDLEIEKCFKKLIDNSSDDVNVDLDLNFPGIYKKKMSIYKNENETQESAYDDCSLDEDVEFNIISKIKSEASSIGSMVSSFIAEYKSDILLLQGNAVRLKPIMNTISKNLNNLKPKVIPSRLYSPYMLPSIGGAQWYSLKGEKVLENEAILSEEDRELGDIIFATVAGSDIKKTDDQNGSSSCNLRTSKINSGSAQLLKNGDRENISQRGFSEIGFSMEDASCGLRLIVEYPGKSIEEKRPDKEINFTISQLDEYFNKNAENLKVIAFTRDKTSISEKTFVVDVSGNKNGWLKYHNIHGTGGKTGALCLFRLYKYKNDLKIETIAEIYVDRRELKAEKGSNSNYKDLQIGEKISIDDKEVKSITASIDKKDISICAVEFDNECKVKSSVGKNIREIEEKIVKWNDNEITIDISEMKAQNEIKEVKIIAKSNDKIEIGRKRYDIMLKDQNKIFAKYKNESCYNCTENLISILRIYKYKDQIKIVIAVDEKIDANSAKAAEIAFDNIKFQEGALSGDLPENIELGTKFELTKNFENISISIDNKDVQIIDIEHDRDGVVLKKGHIQKIKKQNGVSIKMKDLINDNKTKEVLFFVSGLNNKKVFDVEFTADLSINGNLKYRYHNKQIKLTAEGTKKFSKMLLFHIYERNGKWWMKTSGDFE
ncbi:MAG TPA: hypothetical protein PLZ43_11820 [bacterium]|nr:hypothetical protein [bacterium]